MAVSQRSPLQKFAEFVTAYLLVALATSAAVAWIADAVVDVDYWTRLKFAFTLFGVIWLYVAGVEVVKEIRDERGI